MNKNYQIAFLIALGLIIRLVLIPFPGFKIDVDDWFAWAQRLEHFDFAHFYSNEVFTDYTPGYLYILSVLGFLKNSLSIPDNFFYFLLKVPAIISELLIGLLVFKEIKKYVSQRLAIFALVLIIFNPVMIFNSSVWGQVDSILTLLMLIAVIALRKNKLIISSVFFGLAFLVKPQALALIPMMALFLGSHIKLSNLAKIILPGFLIIFILTFPFFPNQTIVRLIEHIVNSTNLYSYTSINAYNVWGVVGFWLSDKQVWNNFSYQVWGYLLFLSYWMIVGYFFLKKKLSIYAVATLATLTFFFLPTRVHERYLYPAIVFLILLAIMYKSKLLVVLTGILSLLHLLNLYYVYVYYNEFYFKLPKMLYQPLLYNFVSSSSKILSLVSVVIFILISIVILKHDIASQKD